MHWLWVGIIVLWRWQVFKEETQHIDVDISVVSPVNIHVYMWVKHPGDRNRDLQRNVSGASIHNGEWW